MKILNMILRFGIYLFAGPRLYVTAYKSDQVTTIDDVGFGQLKPNEAVGRMRISFFSVLTLATGGADGDSIALCEIPKGARILGIKTCNEALGSSVVAAIGISGTAAKYGTGIDMAAAGEDFCANTIALNYGTELTAKERLIITLTGAAPAASKKIYGHVTWVQD